VGTRFSGMVPTPGLIFTEVYLVAFGRLATLLGPRCLRCWRRSAVFDRMGRGRFLSLLVLLRLRRRRVASREPVSEDLRLWLLESLGPSR
jgi:hypothetical protein